MKLLVLFAAVATMATGDLLTAKDPETVVAVEMPVATTWTLAQLEAALVNPNTEPALIPYLEQALNQFMASLMAGISMEHITINLPAALVPVAPAPETPATVSVTWTLPEIEAAMFDPSTDPALMPYLMDALNKLMAAMFAGEEMTSITVAVPAGLVPVEIAPSPVVIAEPEPAPAMVSVTWTLPEIEAALANPSTDPALKPYLVDALNKYMAALFAGESLTSITVAVPAGLVPVEIAPSPVVIAEPEPAPAMVSVTWTLPEIEAALANPSTDPALKPYLVDALNKYMAALFAGESLTSITVAVPAGLVPVEIAPSPVVIAEPEPAPAMVSVTWTLTEIEAALANPSTDPALMPYLVDALNKYMAALFAGESLTSITVAVPAGLVPVEIAPSPVVIAEPEPAPAMVLVTWTLPEIEAALNNPTTDPALKPYLVEALNQYMEALFAGHDLTSITVSVPASLVPVEVAPTPVVVAEPEPTPVVVAEPEAASSPLVQIIVNVNAQQMVAA